MKQKQMTAIAVGCGILCAICVAGFMVSVQGQADAARAEVLARYGGEQVEVCVAKRDIAAGERVELSAIETKLWVADLLPDGALTSSSDAVGKIATSSILKGEVVSEKRFESTRDALEIPAGKAAVSVPAKAVQAVGGAVRPGVSVDVYSAGDTTTVEIAHSVVVLATSVGDSGSFLSSDSGWITLAVEPESVEEIIAASHKTTLYFVIPGEQIDEAGAQQEGGRQAGAGGEGNSSGSGKSAKSAAASSSDAQNALSAPSDLKASNVADAANPEAEAANAAAEEGGDR